MNLTLFPRITTTCLLISALSACGGDQGAGNAPTGDAAGDVSLRDVLERSALTGDPALAKGLFPVKPDDDALVKLGQLLFFSQTLSAGFDVSCATCHLPHMGGGDGLSLSVGVVPQDRHVAGPGRQLDALRDRDPQADGGPNMHRNSATTFNTALLDRAVMSDGRIQVLPELEVMMAGGHGQPIRTPETGNGADDSGASGLLEAMAPFPIVNNNEMRGFLYADLSAPTAYRERLVQRLRGEADQLYLTEGAAQNWLARFRAAFSAPEGEGAELINMLNVQRALAAYMSSQVFVDNQWKQYVDGNNAAITSLARRGAMLFLSSTDEGGLGCASCHSGDRFTDEGFYNVGFPQLGRGFDRAEGNDVGRWQVSRRADDWFAHRTPSLLNIDLTAPYGHSGSFASLESLLRYHVNPRGEIDHYDFSLRHLPQFSASGFSYPNAEVFTRQAISHSSFLKAETLLPQRQLGTDEEAALVAFLRSLSDSCAADSVCRGQWQPRPEEDPDGHQLFALNGPAPDVAADPLVQTPGSYPEKILFDMPLTSSRNTFSDVQGCTNGLVQSANQNVGRFERRDQALNLTATHGFGYESWFPKGSYALEFVMIAGGVSAAYLDDDCWADLVMTGGDVGGMIAYRNLGFQSGFDFSPALLSGTRPADEYTHFTSVGIADITGDYRRELVYANLKTEDLVIKSKGDDGFYGEIARLPMSRNTYGVSFGDVDHDGDLELFLAHWDFSGVPGTAPALLRNLSGLGLAPMDEDAGTTTVQLDQRFNFVGSFSDILNFGVQDLLVSSDFGTSTVLQNDGSGVFDSRTDRDVITDENGMGAAVGDINNDGLLDWFVSSILDPNGVAEANWGVTGNRLYLNQGGEYISFTDIGGSAGVQDGSWAWGVCMADFNQDGFLDIFQVNGFGYMPDYLRGNGQDETLDASMSRAAEFIDQPPRLFVNNGDETFDDVSAAWGLDVPSEGRGVACFDYDRDGDIDVVFLDHSRGLQFFENQIGHHPGSRFLQVRLVGRSPNTDALGTKVYATADVGGGKGLQRQLRVSQANSNFNGQNLPDLHFGVGHADRIAVLRVEWPDGTGLVCRNVDVNQFLIFDQRDMLWPKFFSDSPDCLWHPNIVQIISDAFTP